MIEIIVEDQNIKESQIGTGDQESRALIATKARWTMKKALRSGKKQSQAWWNKQVKLADIDANDKPVAVIQKILDTKEEVEIDEMPNRANMEKVNSLIKKYSGKFKWRDEVLYVKKGIEKDVTSLIKKGGLTATVKVSSNPMREDTTVASVDMNPTGKSKKKKCETFNVSDDCFNMFRRGKIKFERWSKYLDLTDASQKKIYDWAKRHHNGTIILQNSVTGQVRGIRYNRTGGGQWGKISRLKEQVLQTNKEFKVK